MLTSALSLGSEGGASVNPIFSRFSMRAGSAGTWTPSNCLACFGHADGFIAGALAGGGGKRLGVVGDEVFLNPGSAAGLDAEIVQLHFRVVEKFLGVVGGGLGLRLQPVRTQQNGWNSDTQDERSHRVMIPSYR